jgi:hypothetical protein
MSEEAWDQARYDLEVAKLTLQINSLGPGELTTDTLQALISHFPKIHQTPVFALVMSGLQTQKLASKKLDYDYSIAKGKQALEGILVSSQASSELRAFWTGFGLLIIALAASAFLPMNNVMTALVIRVMAAAGVGLLIAYLPGLFSLDSDINANGVKVALKATGGMAALVMVYLFDPGTISALLHH